MLGVHNGLSKKFTSIAKNLLYTCYQMYKQMPTHLSPEIMHFNLTKGATQDMYVKVCVHDCLIYILQYYVNSGAHEGVPDEIQVHVCNTVNLPN